MQNQTGKIIGQTEKDQITDNQGNELDLKDVIGEGKESKRRQNGPIPLANGFKQEFRIDIGVETKSPLVFLQGFV